MIAEAGQQRQARMPDVIRLQSPTIGGKWTESLKPLIIPLGLTQAPSSAKNEVVGYVCVIGLPAILIATMATMPESFYSNTSFSCSYTNCHQAEKKWFLL